MLSKVKQSFIRTRIPFTILSAVTITATANQHLNIESNKLNNKLEYCSVYKHINEYFNIPLKRTFGHLNYINYVNNNSNDNSGSDMEYPNPKKYNVKYCQPITLFSNKFGESVIYYPNKNISDEFIQDSLIFYKENIVWQYRNDDHLTSWYVQKGCQCEYEYDDNDPQIYHEMPEWIIKRSYDEIITFTIG